MHNAITLSCAILSGLLFCSPVVAMDTEAGIRPPAVFEDDMGCLLCHKFPKLGRVKKNGETRTYYILPQVFANTVHRNVLCTDCHSYIRQLPHKKVEQGVRCDAECHSIKNPATGRKFSHKIIYEKYRQSTHYRPKLAKGYDQDKPYCVTCHTNPIYNPEEEHMPTDITDRCVVCHEDRKFVDNWYKHTSRRINQVKRSSREIVELCSSCHGDEKLIKRHLQAAEAEGRQLGRKYPYAATSYKDSFHGKVTGYGFTQAANCLSCHAETNNYFLNVHYLRPSRDEASPVHKNNRLKTCRRCHTYADENYAALDPHPTSEKKDNPFRYYAELTYAWVGDLVFVGLIALAAFETWGRRRDGVYWRLRHGSSWSRQGGDHGRSSKGS